MVCPDRKNIFGHQLEKSTVAPLENILPRLMHVSVKQKNRVLKCCFLKVHSK